MKKIIKKALSLMLVLALVLVPMTAMAGAGTESDPIVLDNATTTITTDGTGNSVYYLYNAPVVADYEILVTGEIDSFGNSIIHPMTGMPFENYAMGGSLTLFAYETNEVTFSLFDYESQNLTVTITMIEGSEVENGGDSGATGATPDDAIELTPDSPYATLPGGGSMTYYKVAVEANEGYTLSISSRQMADFDLYTYNPMFAQYGYNTSAINSVIETTVTPDSTEYIFAIGNPGDLEVSVMITMTKEGSEDSGTTNSIDNPEVITEMGSYEADMPAGASAYWYKWTATEAGVLTVTTTNEGGYAGFTVNGDWECTTESFDNGGKVMVDAGDVVVFYVSPAGASTVNMTASFEAGAVIEQEEEPSGGEETNFEMGNAIVLGDNAISGPSDWTHIYTVHEFTPGEIGKYTFTTTDSQIGIVSTNGMWINVGNPGEDYDTNNVPYLVVVEDEIVWECTDASQSIWIAVMPDENSANVNVAKEELDDSDEIPWTVYENLKAPTAFEYKDDASKLQFVDIEDGVSNTAVLGEDGYYHLDKADGPILFVNLNDELMSLVSMVGYGKIAAIYYENEEVVEKVDYTDALLEYIENADVVDEQTTLYPLTADLIEIFQEVGASNNWFDADNEFGVGSSNADAWMYACYYDEAITSLAPPTDAPLTDSNTSTSTPSTSVKTGDSVNVFAWVAVMMVGLAAVVVVLRKRAR